MEEREDRLDSPDQAEAIGTKRIAFLQAPEQGEYRPTVQQLDADGTWRTIWECPHTLTHNWTMAHSCAANSVEGDKLDNIVVLP